MLIISLVKQVDYTFFTYNMKKIMSCCFDVISSLLILQNGYQIQGALWHCSYEWNVDGGLQKASSKHLVLWFARSLEDVAQP